MTALKGRFTRLLAACLALLLPLAGCQRNRDADPGGSSCLERAIFGPPAQSPYVLPYPVGTSYEVLQAYCGPYSHFDQLAYDFLLPVGSEVTAARAGDVVAAHDLYPDSDLAGDHFNYLFIRHEDGTVAFYAHLQLGTMRVKVGERVAAGQAIARSGHCGTTVADLHFGVYQGWPTREGFDLAVNFRNADGPLDSRGGLRQDVAYLALPY